MSETEDNTSSSGFHILELHTTTAVGSLIAFLIVAMLIAAIVACASGCLSRSLYTCRAWWTRRRGVRQPTHENCGARETSCGATQIRYNSGEKDTCDMQKLFPNTNVITDNVNNQMMQSILP